MMAALIAFIDWIAHFAISEVFDVMRIAIGLTSSMFMFAALNVMAIVTLYLLILEAR